MMFVKIRNVLGMISEILIAIYWGIMVFLVRIYGTKKHKIVFFSASAILSLPMLMYSIVSELILESIIFICLTLHFIELMIKAIFNSENINGQRDPV